jgi:hypothetical protein
MGKNRGGASVGAGAAKGRRTGPRGGRGQFADRRKQKKYDPGVAAVGDATICIAGQGRPRVAHFSLKRCQHRL